MGSSNLANIIAEVYKKAPYRLCIPVSLSLPTLCIFSLGFSLTSGDAVVASNRIGEELAKLSLANLSRGPKLDFTHLNPTQTQRLQIIHFYQFFYILTDATFIIKNFEDTSSTQPCFINLYCPKTVIQCIFFATKFIRGCVACYGTWPIRDNKTGFSCF